MASDAAPAEDIAVLLEAFRHYRSAALRLPPVPRELAPALAAWSEWRYGTTERDLTDRDGFLADAADAATAPEVGFGHVGHGVASWWLCYRLILDPLAVFVRQSFGNIYDDAEGRRSMVNRTAWQLEELVVTADAARASGRLPAPQRLVVVVDERDGSGWFVAGGAPDWQDSAAPIAAAIEWLGGSGSGGRP